MSWLSDLSEILIGCLQYEQFSCAHAAPPPLTEGLGSAGREGFGSCSFSNFQAKSTRFSK